MASKLTTVYFVRHCKPDHKNMDDRNRPLTEEILDRYEGKTIAIGTHGTALSSRRLLSPASECASQFQNQRYKTDLFLL